MPPRGRTLADLIRMGGDIEAQREMDSANIWGGGIQNILGQIGAALPGYAQASEQDQQAKQWQDYARAYDDYLKIMRPGGIGF